MKNERLILNTACILTLVACLAISHWVYERQAIVESQIQELKYAQEILANDLNYRTNPENVLNDMHTWLEETSKE